MLQTAGNKTAQILLITLLPALFILAYFSFKYPVGALNKKPSLSAEQLALFVSNIDSQMVLVAGGKFNMGSDSLGEKEKPLHVVEVSSFYISKTMVTVEQFSFFITATGYKTNAERDSGSFVFDGHSWVIQKSVNWRCDELGQKQIIANNQKPVLHISYYDAIAFCNWLNKISGKKYRLPTEAEWEFAAKGGIKTKGYIYSGGNDANLISWNGSNSALTVHPVAQRQANELGLYDMSGNAWQWCSDWYNENYYKNRPLINPQGPEKGSEKILRGGSYLSGSGLAGDEGATTQLYPAYRGKEFPYLSAGDGSFRIALDSLAH